MSPPETLTHRRRRRSVAAEEVDVDAFAEAAEGGEEPPRPSGVPRWLEIVRSMARFHLAPDRVNSWAQRVNKVYRAATTSLEFMSMVMVHPEVPRNSNGAGLGPRR